MAFLSLTRPGLTPAVVSNEAMNLHTALFVTIAWVAILLCPRATAVAARDTITWMESDMPPYFINSGPLQRQGYGNVITNLITAQLPDYDHRFLVTNVVRHFNRMKQGEKVCVIGLYKTPEREAFIEFSIPSMLTMPAVLAVRKERMAEFIADPSLNLTKLLQNRQAAIGYSKDRSYGVDLDQILKNPAFREQFVGHAGQAIPANFVKMLMLNRLDGILGMPDETMYLADTMGIKEQIALLPLAENRGDYSTWFCYVGCAKTDWGRTVIAKVNKVLLDQRPTEPYRAAYERWLDSHCTEFYRKIYEENFLPVTR